MGIYEKRFSKLVSSILKKELQKGNLPSSREFISKVNKHLQEQNLNSPSFKFKPVRDGSVAYAKDLAQSLTQIYNDLSVLYEGIIDQHNKITKNFNKFETDKEKIHYEINDLEEKLHELTLIHTTPGLLSSVFDVFADLQKVDTEASTAHVDIKKHEVSIPDIKSRSKKVGTRASVSFQLSPQLPLIESKSVAGKLSNIINDNVDEVWQQKIILSERQQVSGYVYINFEKKQETNRILLQMHTPQPTFARIEFTPDDINWFTLPYYEQGVMIEDQYEFTFPRMEVQRLRVLLEKNEPDHQFHSYSRYAYTLGIKSIDFFEMGYETQATLISKPLKVEEETNFTINKVSLLVEEELPNGTNIDYFIGLPSESEVEWKNISPINSSTPEHEQVIDFKNITHSPAQTFAIDPAISIAEYEMDHLYANGISFYKIGEIEGKKIIPGTERLYIGRNTWGAKSFTGEQESELHSPTLRDWEKPLNNIKQQYIKIDDGKPGVILNGKTHDEATNYMFTLGIFSEHKEELLSFTPASTDPITIYINGQKIFEGKPSSSTSVNALFKNGWNEIVVLSYIKDSVGSSNGATIDLNFNPKAYGSNLYARTKPLDKVSVFDLRYNVKNNDRTKYAIVQTESESMIILNHAEPGLEYDMFYNYVDGRAQNEILFKAELYRDEKISEVSPKLKSYRLRFN